MRLLSFKLTRIYFFQVRLFTYLIVVFGKEKNLNFDEVHLIFYFFLLLSVPFVFCLKSLPTPGFDDTPVSF